MGGGSAQQIEAIGRYYESIGIAFQIMDDVLNLRGIYSGKADAGKAGTELKTRGEDITAGKVTIPVVKAMSRLPLGEMRALWEVINQIGGKERYFFGNIPWVKLHLDKIIWGMILVPGLIVLGGAWKARRTAAT